MNASDCIIGCWIVYLLYWVTSAIRVKPVAERQPYWREAIYKFPTALGGALLILGGYRYPFDYRLWERSPIVAWTGVVVCVSGLAIAIWARRTLAGNWSSTVTFKKDHELVERGPYRFVRHPIYTGILLMCAGTALRSAAVGACVGTVILTGSFWLKLRQEEVLMQRHFPDEYPSYKARVKALIPFVF